MNADRDGGKRRNDVQKLEKFAFNCGKDYEVDYDDYDFCPKCEAKKFGIGGDADGQKDS